MTISHELKANILRYHHVEKWRVGTINRVRLDWFLLFQDIFLIFYRRL